MYESNNSILSIKSDAFSTRIVRMVNYLNKNCDKIMSPLFNQVLRSGTSIAANIGESQFAQSRADFINKLHIATKEANETRKWLLMLFNGGCITKQQFESMDADCNEIIAILVASLKTSKTNLEQVVK